MTVCPPAPLLSFISLILFLAHREHIVYDCWTSRPQPSTPNCDMTLACGYVSALPMFRSRHHSQRQNWNSVRFLRQFYANSGSFSKMPNCPLAPVDMLNPYKGLAIDLKTKGNRKISNNKSLWTANSKVVLLGDTSVCKTYQKQDSAP